MNIEIFNDITKEIIKASSNFKIQKIMLTGSYASKLLSRIDYQQKGISDFNYYVYLDGNDIETYKMNQIIHEAIEKILVRNEIEYTLDIHPFAYSVPNDKASIQITTRSISTKKMEEFANYCWNGWAMNLYVLFENEELIDPFLNLPKLTKDERWEVAISQALSSYRNKIMNLPLFTMDSQNQLIEIIRYCKEIIKDGIQINMSNTEFEKGIHFKYLHEGREGIIRFYKENKLFVDKIHLIEEILAFNDKTYNKNNNFDEIINKYLEIFFDLYKSWIKIISKNNTKIYREQMQWY